MKKRVIISIIGFLALTITWGCAALIKDTIDLDENIATEARKLPTQSDKALIYVIREGKYAGSGALTAIGFHNNEIILQGNKSFSYTYISPGKITISIDRIYGVFQEGVPLSLITNKKGTKVGERFTYRDAHKAIIFNYPITGVYISESKVPINSFYPIITANMGYSKTSEYTFEAKENKTYFIKYVYQVASGIRRDGGKLIEIFQINENEGRDLINISKLSISRFGMDCENLFDKSSYKDGYKYSDCRLMPIEGFENTSFLSTIKENRLIIE